jgi:hypothetical protein
METNQENSFLQMQLDHDGSHILRETARWSRFLSLVGLVGLGVGVLVVALAASALTAALSRYAPELAALGGLGTAVLVICALVGAALGGLVFYMLYRFSTLTRRGIDGQDQVMFAEGMRCLKIYFLINGIFGLLGLLTSLFSLTKLFHS